MKDRQSTHPGRVKLTEVVNGSASGSTKTYDLVRDDSPTETGTPLNKATFMTDSTASNYGLSGNDALPENAFKQLSDFMQIGSIHFLLRQMRHKYDTLSPMSYGWLLCNGNSEEASKYPDFANMLDNSYYAVESLSASTIKNKKDFFNVSTDNVLSLVIAAKQGINSFFQDNDKKWYSVGQNDNFESNAYSASSVTGLWADAELSYDGLINGMCYVNGNYIAIGFSDKYLTGISNDVMPAAELMIKPDIKIASDLTSGSWDNKELDVSEPIAVLKTVASAPDGRLVTGGFKSSGSDITALIAYTDSAYSDWQTAEIPEMSLVNSISYAQENGIWVAIGYCIGMQLTDDMGTPIVATSEDGLFWNIEAPSGLDNFMQVTSVAAAQGMYVIGGCKNEQGMIAYSSDLNGTFKTVDVSNTFSMVNALAFDGTDNLLLLGGINTAHTKANIAAFDITTKEYFTLPNISVSGLDAYVKAKL